MKVSELIKQIESEEYRIKPRKGIAIRTIGPDDIQIVGIITIDEHD